MQHLVSIAKWDTTSSSTETVISYPVSWYLYGAGPRLQWQWVIIIPLAVPVFILAYDIYLTVQHRVKPAPWLTLSGMMLVANRSGWMESAARSVAGIAIDKSLAARYFIRAVDGDTLELTDDVRKGFPLLKTRVYGESKERITHRSSHIAPDRIRRRSI